MHLRPGREGRAAQSGRGVKRSGIVSILESGSRWRLRAGRRSPVHLHARLLSIRDTGCLLVFHDTSFDGKITIDKGIDVAFAGGPRKTYLITGTPSAILTRFTELTGRPPLPPRWAFGYQHSRWGFGTEKEVRRVVQGFRDNRLPPRSPPSRHRSHAGFRTLTTDP